MDIEATEDVINTQDDISDNSVEVLGEEPPQSDNSSDEAQKTEPEIKKDNVDNVGKEVVKGKFATLDEANKGYFELQKKLGEQSNELGALRKQVEEANRLKQERDFKEAQENGYDSIEDYQYSKEIANNTADLYAKYIKEVEFPTQVVKLLDEYRSNPSDELLEAIENQFSVETIKKVAGANEIFKGQLEINKNQALENEIRVSAEEYLNEYVGKYADEFNNPAFTALYGEAFRAYGCDLQTDKFVELMRAYADSVIKAKGIQNGIKNDNKSATDEIAGTNFGTSKSSKRGNLATLSADELDSRLSELI